MVFIAMGLVVTSMSLSADADTRTAADSSAKPANPGWAGPFAEKTFEGPDLVQHLGRVVLSLVAIVILLYGAAWTLKKLYFSRSGSGKGTRIEVIGSVAIAPKKSITLVRVLGKVLVLGVAESGITLLAQLEEAAVASELAPEAEKQAKARGQFSKMFQAALGQR